MTDAKRMILALILSMVIVGAWQYFFITPINQESAVEEKNSVYIPPKTEIFDRENIIESGKASHSRIEFENELLKGSINLEGARFDDVELKTYKETIEKDSANVKLLSPSKTTKVNFVQFGWIGQGVDLPDSHSKWSSTAQNLSQNGSVTLSWKNKDGIEFFIDVAIDNEYMFNITQRVVNHTQKHIALKAYTLINRKGEASDNMIIHEGGIAMVNGSLVEIGYDDMPKKLDKNPEWIGFSDKYWLSAIIPSYSSTAKFREKNQKYQLDLISNEEEIAPNSSYSFKSKLFAGAKKIEILDKYQKQLGLTLFDRAVDFGWLYFITKPIFLTLNYFHGVVGNFGIAILFLTVVIKLLLFPLAYKGFKGMNKLKDLQPEMVRLKEKFKDNAQGFQKALLELYKKENANPLSGCLPILLQMPIFFALYKVLYVSIEMRHAYFISFVKDLSAPDVTNIFNIFGLLPWDPPSFLHIGIFPILMAFTMFIQQKLSPAPTDPMQAKVMKILPLVLLFMFASFPVGLIIYWAWSNTLSIAQQLFIKKITSSK